MGPLVRRSSRFLAALVVGVAVCVLAAPAASADPEVPFSQDIYARTHLARSGIDLAVPPGSFNGTIDLATGEETGTLSLPPATVTMNLFGLVPAADASFVMAPTGPIRGHVDLATFAVDTTASFNVRLARLTPHGTSLNLVGDGCTTTEPVTVRMRGVVNPAVPGTFTSTYTIPPFTNCGLITPAITALVSGPGNTFMATFVPHGSPPPSAAPTTPAASQPLASFDVPLPATTSPTSPAAPGSGDVGVTIGQPALPPLVTATPAPPSTTTAPPATPPATDPVGSLLGSLLGR